VILPRCLTHHKKNPALHATERDCSRPGGIAQFRVSRQIYEIYTFLWRLRQGLTDHSGRIWFYECSYSDPIPAPPWRPSPSTAARAQTKTASPLSGSALNMQATKSFYPRG